MRRVLLIPTIVLIVLFLAAFFSSAGPFTPDRAAARPIVICLADDIKTLDVGKMSWANDIRAAMSLWEGLTVYDTKDNLKPVAGAAKSWEISGDGKIYTFHLRPEAKWSNGDPVIADDFIFAWKRDLTPATGSDYIGLLKDIEGAEEYTEAISKSQPPDDAKLGIKKNNPLTLEIRLKSPCSYFLDLLAMPVFFPLHEKSMQKFQLAKREDGYNEAWTRPPDLVTNGPFALKQWIVKQSLTMTPNPYYWDRDNVKCPALQFKTITDSRTALINFQAGDVDLLTFIPADFADDLVLQHDRDHKWPELHHQGVFGTYYYIFNCARKPFDDKRVRKALALAIDREQIVRLLNTGENALGLLVPPDSINGYKSPPQLKSNLEEARRLLADAGYPDGKGLKAIELLYNNEARHSKVALAVAQMWKQNLGVDVINRGLERGSFGTARRQDHAFDIARGGWYGDYPDPTTWLDLFRSTDGNNDGKFASKTYDDLMAKSDSEPDPAKRLEILRQAEELLVQDELPFIPLYQYADGFFYDEKKLEGAEMNVRMMTELKWIRRKTQP